MEPVALPTPEEEISGEHGAVFTRRWVVELILDLCGYTADKDLVALRAVEPACGSGAFLVAMVERLVASAEIHGRVLEDGLEALKAVDLLQGNVDLSRAAVSDVLQEAGVATDVTRRLTERWVERADFLLMPLLDESADFVVGNPPYVRLESIPTARSDAYRRVCTTMGGRADIYVGFYERGLRVLRSGGTLGFICADRWMRNAYGAGLRGLVSEGWAVETIVSMTGVDAFEEEVNAYPAITVFRRGCQLEGPLVVDAAPEFAEQDARSVALIAHGQADSAVGGRRFRAARLHGWFRGRAGWPHGSPERLAAIADMEDRLPPLEDAATGTRVGIGVATGADRVFVVGAGADIDIESERLLPLALPRDIASGALRWSGKHLVNPWDEAGLVDLADWPRLANYLVAHQALLVERHTAKRGRWHKTIDRVINGLAERPKLYIPDFKEMIFPVLDEGTTYPHHNLYWVTSDVWDLRVLGGLLLSDIANMFIESYSVRMRGGYLRFQAQYLRRIRLPRLEAVERSAALALATAFDQRDRSAATKAALPLYGMSEVPG